MHGLNEWLPKGALKARIARIMPLAEAAAAHRLLENSQHGIAKLSGDIVFTV